MRSLFALASSAWFGYNAAMFLPPWGTYPNGGQAGGLDGDAGAVAVVYGVRALCVGFTLLSLAGVDWKGAWDAISGKPARD